MGTIFRTGPTARQFFRVRHSGGRNSRISMSKSVTPPSGVQKDYLREFTITNPPRGRLNAKGNVVNQVPHRMNVQHHDVPRLIRFLPQRWRPRFFCSKKTCRSRQSLNRRSGNHLRPVFPGTGGNHFWAVRMDTCCLTTRAGPRLIHSLHSLVWPNIDTAHALKTCRNSASPGIFSLSTGGKRKPFRQS